MAERVLTQRDLNRALLARQLLLERSRAPIPRVLEQVAGLQTQYAPSGYIGLWTRLDGFHRDDLTRALERRTVVQGTLMRATIHLVSARDYPLFAAGVRDARREWWARVHKGADVRAVAAAARRIGKALADGPRGRSELIDLLRANAMTWNGVNLWIDLVRAPPSGTWEQRRADVFASAAHWLGTTDAAPEEGIEHLISRYLGGFGPARANEIADWAGLPLRAVTSALAAMRVRRFRDEDGRELVDLLRAPLPDPETPVPVRFLPTFDATLLVHARATGILPEHYRPRVFTTKTPHSIGTFLVDGAVAGTWRYDRGRVVTEPFARPAGEAKRQLAEEAERLAAFHS